MRRGWTSKRCEGCGRRSNHDPGEDDPYGWERKQGENCCDCEADRKAGRAAIAELAKIQGREGETLWSWVSADYAWPTYRAVRSHAGFDTDADALSDAVWQLVADLSRPAPDNAPIYSKRYEMHERNVSFDGPGRGKVRHYLRWPKLIGSDDDWNGLGRFELDCIVLCRPSVRDRLIAVDDAIRVALNVAWEDGKALGGTVLRALASGEMSMDDFDETLERRRDR